MISPDSVFKVSSILLINYFSGKVSEEALTEEEQLNDLLLLVKLLTNLLSKDILDYGSGEYSVNSVDNCGSKSFSSVLKASVFKI